MTKAADGTVEITMYGDIVSRRPVNWWSGKPIEGNFIILTEFMEDLKKMESATKIRIRIHSAGGNAYDAMTIHNRLKELVSKGKEVEVIVDGVALSGGSLIMCAASKVKVFPGSLVMIHRCWGFVWGGLNAPELRRIADHFDAVDRSQAAVYHAKSRLSQDTLLDMMEQETYMTGQEAIDKGLADELMEGSTIEIAASADRKTLYVGGMPVWASSREDGIPSHLALPVFPAAEAQPAAAAGNNYFPFFEMPQMPNGIEGNPPEPSGENNNLPTQTGGKDVLPMARTLEELRKENPELANQLMAEAQAAASAELSTGVSAAAEDERKRLQEIDKISALFDDVTVREAKYGDKPCTAQEMAHRAAVKAADEGKSFMKDLADDAAASKSKEVGAAPVTNEFEKAKSDAAKTHDQKLEEAKAQKDALLGKKKEG